MAGKNKKSTVEVVYELAKPIADSLGLNIWDIRFLKEGAGWYLRIFIDKPEGITIEDCENMSRAIDEPLDKADPIDQNYCLEVCSPGLERELIKEEQLQKVEGLIDTAVSIAKISGISKDEIKEMLDILYGEENENKQNK